MDVSVISSETAKELKLKVDGGRHRKKLADAGGRNLETEGMTEVGVSLG